MRQLIPKLLVHLSYFWTRETVPLEKSGKQEYVKIISYGFDESVFSEKIMFNQKDPTLV